MAQLDRTVVRVLRAEIGELQDQRAAAAARRQGLRDQKAELLQQVAAVDSKITEATAEIDDIAALIDGLRSEADARQLLG